MVGRGIAARVWRCRRSCVVAHRRHDARHTSELGGAPHGDHTPFARQRAALEPPPTIAPRSSVLSSVLRTLLRGSARVPSRASVWGAASGAHARQHNGWRAPPPAHTTIFGGRMVEEPRKGEGKKGKGKKGKDKSKGNRRRSRDRSPRRGRSNPPSRSPRRESSVDMD